MIDVCILGASGFGGAELLRLLLAHPNVASISAVSRSHAGKAIASQHPQLRALLKSSFEADIDFEALAQSSHPVLFAALPHGEFAKLWPQLQVRLPAQTCVIDLSADFRLQDAAAFANAYGYPHPCPEQLGRFQYGLAEASVNSLLGAKRIANPGCFATAIALAMMPLAAMSHDLGVVNISAVTGSSGSGATPGLGTHHPTRAHDFRAYKILNHQHESEIRAALVQVAAAHKGHAPRFTLVPHSAPMVRGIFATCQFQLPKTLSADALSAQFQHYYRGSRFVSVIDDSPRVAAIAGSNFCELSVHVQGQDAAVLCALDNLGKGMAGQALQNMNLALGLPETAGLLGAGLLP
jgi:LysW-gamma-L-alpha-aminoadipyl-6-phosphate/LysW-L-glutamyl-5-phosphate reductase